MGKKNIFIVSSVIIFLSVLIDQLTKIIAKHYLQAGKEITAIPYLLGFSYVENKGAAFGILSDNRWVFMIFSTVAIILMICVLIIQKKPHSLMVISLSMLIGGGIGNMIDRFFRGYVIDFFEFLFVRFAIFNVADCFVTIGAVILAIYLIFFYEEMPTDKSIEDKALEDNYAFERNDDSKK